MAPKKSTNKFGEPDRGQQTLSSFFFKQPQQSTSDGASPSRSNSNAKEVPDGRGKSKFFEKGEGHKVKGKAKEKEKEKEKGSEGNGKGKGKGKVKEDTNSVIDLTSSQEEPIQSTSNDALPGSSRSSSTLKKRKADELGKISLNNVGSAEGEGDEGGSNSKKRRGNIQRGATISLDLEEDPEWDESSPIQILHPKLQQPKTTLQGSTTSSQLPFFEEGRFGGMSPKDSENKNRETQAKKGKEREKVTSKLEKYRPPLPPSAEEDLDPVISEPLENEIPQGNLVKDNEKRVEEIEEPKEIAIQATDELIVPLTSNTSENSPPIPGSPSAVASTSRITTNGGSVASAQSVERLAKQDAWKKKLLGGGSARRGLVYETEQRAGRAEDAEGLDGQEMGGKNFAGKGEAKKKGEVKYTPLEQQVVEIKKKHPDTVLMVEVGYKYKFFGQDAILASRLLSISHFPQHNFETASIPTQRMEIHLRRLIMGLGNLGGGNRVGVVRQIEGRGVKRVSENKSGPFTRALTELYTPSTFIDSLDSADLVSTPDPTSSSAMPRGMVCLVEADAGKKKKDGKGKSKEKDNNVDEELEMREKTEIGMVYVEFATGEVIYDEFHDAHLRSELETRMLHLRPCELLLPPKGELSKQTEKVLGWVIGKGRGSSASNDVPTRVERIKKSLDEQAATSYVTDFYANLDLDVGMSKSNKAKENGKEKRKRRAFLGGIKDDHLEKGKGKENEREVLEIDDDRQVVYIDDDSDNGVQARSSNGGTKEDQLEKALNLPKLVVIALAKLLRHLKPFELQTALARPSLFVPFGSKTNMILSANTLRNLEIFQNQTDYTTKATLISVLDHTKTAFGKRMLQNWVARPLLSIPALEDRLDAVQELATSDSEVGSMIRPLLSNLPDLERGLSRIHYGKCTTQELYRLFQSFHRVSITFSPVTLPSIKSTLLLNSVKGLPRTKRRTDRFMGMINKEAAMMGKKENLWVDEEMVPEVAEKKWAVEKTKAEIEAHLQEIRTQLKQPKLEYVSVGQEDYLIEVPVKDAKKLVPPSWSLINATKSSHRYRTPKLIKVLEKLEERLERLDMAAEKAWKEFLEAAVEDEEEVVIDEEAADVDDGSESGVLGRREKRSGYRDFRETIKDLATLDCLASLAVVAGGLDYVRPSFMGKGSRSGEKKEMGQNNGAKDEEVRMEVDTPMTDPAQQDDVEEDPDGEGILKVVDGRNPILEQILTDPVVPNSISFQPSTRIIRNSTSRPNAATSEDEPGTSNSKPLHGLRAAILSGSNRGGKSTLARTLSHLVLLAQTGSFVPCTSLTLTIFVSIHTRMGAMDDLIRGRSTFKVEMEETSEILKGCDPRGRSLVLLDEVGRGTSSRDGGAVAGAVLEWLVARRPKEIQQGDANGRGEEGKYVSKEGDGKDWYGKESGMGKRPIVLFITHYPEVESVAKTKGVEEGVVQAFHMKMMEVDAGDSDRGDAQTAGDRETGDDRVEGEEAKDMVWLYKLEEGMAVQSHGLSVARLAGLPDSVLKRSRQKSRELGGKLQDRIRFNRAVQLIRQLGNESRTLSKGEIDRTVEGFLQSSS